MFGVSVRSWVIHYAYKSPHKDVCVWMCVTLNRYFSHIISQRKLLENRTFIAFYLIPSAFSTH